MAAPHDDVRTLPLGDLRVLRREALAEESDLSYLRRLLQGRIDILRAELGGRATGAAPPAPVMARLPEILADGPSPVPRLVRRVGVHPPRTDRYRARIERALSDITLSDPSAHTDGELRAALDRMVRYEEEISARRQVLQRTADDCGTEIARRYREGEARIDDLLHGD